MHSDMATLEKAARQDYPEFAIASFVGHSIDDTHGVFMLQVRWVGFPREFDSPEPIHDMVAAAPHMVEDYLYQHADDPACARYIEEYFPRKTQAS